MTIIERIGRFPAARIVAVLLTLGALALLWTGWSGYLSWLLVSGGLFVAGGLLATAIHRHEEKAMSDGTNCGHGPGYCTDACDGAYAGEISAAEWERDHG